MVIAYHLIWTIYGYWLPNDLRGSTSKFIASDILAELGELHFGRKRIQPTRSELRAFDALARPRLDHPVIEFSSDAINVVAEAFSGVVHSNPYTCYAAAILPDHVHLLIRKHKHSAEQMIANFQRHSHLLLRERGAFEMDHPVWGGHGWKVFLDAPDDVRRTIGYIEKNTRSSRSTMPSFDFVSAYDDWPFHKRR